MSVAVPAKSPAKAATKMTTKLKVAADHPKYSDMIAAAITSLKERGGSSRHAIVNHIMANYKVGTNQIAVNTRIKTALKSGVTKGNLKQVKGTGASGSFRLSEKAVEKKPKVVKPKMVKTPKKATTAKPKAKKAAAKPKDTVVKKVTKPKKAKTPEKATITKPEAAAKPKKAKTPKKATVAKAAAKPKKVKTPKKTVAKKTVAKK